MKTEEELRAEATKPTPELALAHYSTNPNGLVPRIVSARVDGVHGPGGVSMWVRFELVEPGTSLEPASECPNCENGVERGSQGGACSECMRPGNDVNTLARWLYAHAGGKWWKASGEAQEFFREKVRHIAKTIGAAVPEFAPERCVRCERVQVIAGDSFTCSECGRKFRGALIGDARQ